MYKGKYYGHLFLSINSLMTQKDLLKQKYSTEQVLVVTTDNAAIVPDLFTYKLTPDIRSLFMTANQFVYRYDAEYNYALTQLIPYVIITNSDETQLFTATRISGEERLVNQIQLGCGGHVNPQDSSDNTMLTAALREMSEELNVKLVKGTTLLEYGTVRDIDSNTREHLGLVYIAKADKVKVREKDTLSGQWMNMSELVTNYYKFESWSRHVIDHCFITQKSVGRLFMTTPLGAKQYDRKRKKTVR